MTARTILLVEDEPLIAMMLEDLLTGLGHEIVGTADSVAEALARVEKGGFELAILDVHLRGGEPSWPVADALKASGIPFILATGGSSDGPPEKHRDAMTLAKPFTMADVARAVEQV